MVLGRAFVGACLVVGVLSASLAVAQEAKKEAKPRPTAESQFKKLNTSNDGKLTLEQFLKGPMAQRNADRAKEVFAKMDSNKDGAVSLDEYKQAAEARKAAQGQGGKRGGGKKK